jgi:hypothetical protein
MEYIKKAEDKIGEWLKPVPHMPENWRKWLAANVWWLTAIGAILICLSLFAMFMAVVIAFGLTTAIGSYSLYGWGAYGYASTNILLLLINFVAMVVFAGIYISAISPLKKGQKKGWDLMFKAFLLGIVLNVITLLGTLNHFFSGLLNAAIGAFIGAYILFELKSYFVKTAKTEKK